MDRSHIVEVPVWFRTVRLVQIGLAALVLLLNAIGIGLLTAYASPGYGIFTSIATILICTYYLVSTGSRPHMFNWVAVVVLEVFMELWWLSAFSVTAWVASSLAIVNSDLIYLDGYDDGYSGRWHGAYICFAISAAVSAIEWILITTTLITFVLGVTRHNKNQSAHPGVTYVSNPVKMEEGHGYQPEGGHVPVYVQPNGQYVAA